MFDIRNIGLVRGGSNQLALLRFKRPRGLKDLVVWFILMILENKHCDEEEKYWKVCLVCNKQTVTLPRHFVTPVNLWLCKDSVQPETAATAWRCQWSGWRRYREQLLWAQATGWVASTWADRTHQNNVCWGSKTLGWPHYSSRRSSLSLELTEKGKSCRNILARGDRFLYKAS